MNQQKQTLSFKKLHIFLSFIIGIWISFVITVGVSFVIARNSVSVEEMEIKSILVGAGSLILTIPGVWFVLGWIRRLPRWISLIIRFIWDFFLDRITELSNAIRGKKETRSS